LQELSKDMTWLGSQRIVKMCLTKVSRKAKSELIFKGHWKEYKKFRAHEIQSCRLIFAKSGSGCWTFRLFRIRIQIQIFAVLRIRTHMFFGLLNPDMLV